MDVTGIILCGGQSARMGGRDKGLLDYAGLPMVKQVAQGLCGVQTLLLNCNQNQQQYQQLGFDVFTDGDYPDIGNSAGPLLGILSAMQCAKHDWLLFSPCDTPNLPDNYFEKMVQTASDQLSHACVVFDGERQQNLHLLLHKRHRESLEMYLLSGRRKTYEWLDSINVLQVDFSEQPAGFKNFNTPQDFL